MTRWARALTGLCLALPAAVAAQQPPAAPSTPIPATPVRRQATFSLSLGDAMDQARRNSPAYRQFLNDANPAGWGVRNAYANLLPSFDVSSSMSYSGSGASTFGGSTFNQSSPILSSGYSLNFNWQLSGQELAATGQLRASRKAVDADITNAGEQLRNDIAFQYLTALQSVATTEVNRQSVQRNADFLGLARARYTVGQNTMLDVRQAEVTKGQADVALLKSQQAENEAKLELFRRMGVPIPTEPELVALPDTFPVAQLQLDEKQLLAMAREENPSLKAFRARENAASWNTRSAKSRFLPTISVNASLSGYTQEFTNQNLILTQRLGDAIGTAENCRFQNAIIGGLPAGGLPGFPNGGIIGDCNGFSNLDATGLALDPTYRSNVIKQNNVFPFNFSKRPFFAQVQISLPIFDGFTRNLQVSQARAQEDDLTESVRAQQLLVATNVSGRYLGVQSAWQTIQVQEQSRQSAREQMRLAQDRYRLGAGSSLEVSDATNNLARAEGDYVNAVYEYHKAIALLEFAVGRPLR
jgi:outer membrane protein